MASKVSNPVAAPTEGRTCFDKFFGCLKRPTTTGDSQKASLVYQETSPESMRQLNPASTNPQVAQQQKPFSLVEVSRTDKYREPDRILPTADTIFTKNFNPHRGKRGTTAYNERVTQDSIFQDVKQVDLQQAYNLETIKRTVSAIVLKDLEKASPGAGVAENGQPANNIYNEEGPGLHYQNAGNQSQVLPGNAHTVLVQSGTVSKQMHALDDRPLYKEFLRETGGKHFTSHTVLNRGGCSFNIKLEKPQDGEETPQHIYCVEDGCLYLGLYQQIDYNTLKYPHLRDGSFIPVIMYPNGQKFTGSVQSGQTTDRLFCKKQGKLEDKGVLISEGEWNQLDQIKPPHPS